MISLESKPVRVGRSILRFARGAPLPLGATVIRDGINFAIFSRQATAVSLLLFEPGNDKPLIEIPLDRRFNRTGHIWHGFIHNLTPGIHYGYRVNHGTQILLDPYARAITGHRSWSAPRKFRRGLVVEDGFDWGDDQPLNIPLPETIIYEMHVRGFTRDPSSGVSKPGTFAGLIEKIPYLVDLGITAVELLPVHEFEEMDSNRINPFTGERLLNYWGYQPISFFAPNAAYSSDKRDAGQIGEFKQLVRSLHAAGIEVILDVVFNHTAEGDERGPTFSFRGIDKAVYYLLDGRTGRYLNYSGCGNTMNCNHPVVRDLIVECLRYWVMEMHIDGFRFDLASILGRGQDGSVLENPPLLESLAHDPVLANTKLIAEAWDAAGLYQVGTFPAWSRWAEWNGKFRDDVRRFVRGEAGVVSALATRLVGSPDLFHTSQREPYHSINFVTCHDGFTLADLVSYDRKHNEENGENSADGTNENLSWNCGQEGPTDSEEIIRLREKQMRNFATILLLSDGVPMILAGDETGRTQKGNNNAYCQDNEISWINWDMQSRNADLLRFFRLLIQFRRHHPLLRATSFVAAPKPGRQSIEWHGCSQGKPDWSVESRSVALHLSGFSETGSEEHIYLIANAHWEGHVFELPDRSIQWLRFIDTHRQAPDDILAPGQEAALDHPRQCAVGARSTVVLIGKPMLSSRSAGEIGQYQTR